MRMTRPARHHFSLDLVRALRVLTLAALVMALALGCGSESEDPVAQGPQGCPTGSVPWTDGNCMPVGIQGCADIFIEEDGLCHPRMAKCPAGTIPKFDEGCVPVGIQGCAEMFMEEDGLCHPSITKCPAGTIPKFDEGCVPVGIQGCAEVFMEDDGLCHPTMDKCPAGTFAVPQEGCVPIDGPEGCGTGTWGNLQEVAGVTTIWVDPSVAASGNGTMASPVKTIAEAMAMVPVGGRVALGAGTYDEPIHIEKTVTIEGRCPSMVRVQGTVAAATVFSVVWVDAADDVVLRRMEISGAGYGVYADNAAGLTIEGVHVRNSTAVGLALEGSMTEVSIRKSWVDGTLADADGAFGVGVAVENGARATLRESAIVKNRALAVLAIHAGTEVTVTDGLLEGTLPQESDGWYGRGADAESGAKLTLTDSAIVKNHETGVFASMPDTTVSVTQSLVEGTLPSAADWQLGQGVLITAGAGLTLRGSALLDNHNAGVLVQQTPAEVIVTGSLVKGTLHQQSDGRGGVGVAALYARLRLSDSAIIANHSRGLEATGTEADVTAATTLIEANGDRGIYAYAGATLILNGGAVVENHELGVAALQADTDVTVTGSLVSETLPGADEGDLGGIGMAVATGAHSTIRTSALVSNRDVGLLIRTEGTNATAVGNLITRTLPLESSGEYGYGVDIQDRAVVVLDANALIENRTIGVIAGDPGTMLTATRNLIEGATPEEKTKRFGRGMYIRDGPLVTLEGNAIVANREGGLLVMGDGSSVIATSNAIEDTLPKEIDGQYGNAIVCDDGARLELASSILLNNHSTAISIAYATATVSRCLIDTVASGTVTLNDEETTMASVADGVQVLYDATVDIVDTRIQGCARAGVLFNDASGTFSGIVSTDNQFGLVLQGERRPSYEDGNNQFTGNTEQDIVLDGDLPVPDAPTPVPPAPPPPSP